MKNYLKEKVFSSFLFIFEKEMPGQTEAFKRKLANELVESCFKVYLENSQDLIKHNVVITKEYENNRKQFRKFIEEIQNSSEKLLNIYKSESFVTKEYDHKSGGYYLKPRTSMLNETIEHFNYLNSLVVAFYKNVYKIKQTSIEYPKISLF